jgi:hypothetical protein
MLVGIVNKELFLLVMSGEKKKSRLGDKNFSCFTSTC